MQRRKFIKGTLAGLPLILLSCTLLQRSKDDDTAEPNGKTVVVIGAGISGLAVARKLTQQGFAVTVLEAQNKVGGRIKTDRSLGVAFDEGASWIHGPKGNPITKLALESGAKTFLTDDDSVEVFDIDGTAYSDKILVNTEDEYENAVNAVLGAGNKAQSFQAVFNSLYPNQNNDRLWKYMLSAYLEFSIGGDISRMSSKYFYDDKVFHGADKIITNGYDKITDYLASELDIRLNTRVRHIDYSNDKVEISTDGELFKCDYVVTTIPLGVLRSGDVTFSPELPKEKSTAIDQTQMGNVNKFLLIWDTPFWDTSLQYIGYTPDIKGAFNYFLNLKKFSSENALMTFAFGDYATTTERMSDRDIIDGIMSHLQGIYGHSIPSPTNMLRTKWGQNVNAYGAYSFATNGSTSADFDTLAESVDNKLFFAGEHTSRKYRGTVHGAYLSGIREAKNIIKLSS